MKSSNEVFGCFFLSAALPRPRTPYNTMEELLDGQCKEMQSVMDEEIVLFFRRFNEKLENIRKQRFVKEDDENEDTDDKKEEDV